MDTPIHSKASGSVKIPGKITITIAVFIIVVCTAYLNPGPVSVKENVDNYYTKQLQVVKEKLITFKKLGKKKVSLELLQQQFYQSRLAYKKLAVLTGYFNIYETKSLNYPAIDRIEEDNPDKIIHPEGFQAIEQLLFSSWNAKSYEPLNSLLDKMLATISRLQNEIDRVYKFSDELVWDAMRTATVRLTTLDITGFDSPAAQYSLPEARASIEGIKDILTLFKKEAGNKKFLDLFNLLNKASGYLLTHPDFNEFDRLIFITQYINPFYKELLTARLKTGIGVPEGSNPVNFNAASIFAADAFTINFYSPDKAYWMTHERIELGKKLFFDPILSGTNTRSCASCHQPEKAFTDGLKIPFALDGKTILSRNTPTLWNSALQTRQFLDSRTDILENQLDEVVHNQAEMKGSLKNSVIKLQNSSGYNFLFQQAYANVKEPVTPFTIANAISSYVRSLIALNSRFDQYMRGDKTKLTMTEKNGFNLFTGKAKCATCHFIPLFNGLVPPVFTETESEVIGVPKTKKKNPAELDNDLGKYLFTKSDIHKHSFKTPTLRNIALTAPYMHNGVYSTLEEVMEFYNNGGGKGLKIAPSNQTLPFDKLNLSKKEIADIISFMKTLTDTTVNNKENTPN